MGIYVTTCSAAPTNFSCSLSAGGTFPTGTYDFRIQARNCTSYLNVPSYFLTSCSDALYVSPTTGNQTMNFTWDYKTGYNYYIISYKDTGSNTWYTASHTKYTAYCSHYATGSSQCSGAISSSGQDTTNAYSFINYASYLPFNKYAGNGLILISGSTPTASVLDLKNAVVAAGDEENFGYDGGTQLYSNYHIYFSNATGTMDVSFMDLNMFGGLFYNVSPQFTITASYTRFVINGYGTNQDIRNISMSGCTLMGGLNKNPNGFPLDSYIIGGNLYGRIYGETTGIRPSYFDNCIAYGLTVQHYAGARVSRSFYDGACDMRNYGQDGGTAKMSFHNSEFSYIMMISNIDCTDLDKNNYEFRNCITAKKYTGQDIEYYYDIKRARFYDCKFELGKRTYTGTTYNKPKIYYYSLPNTTETWMYHQLDLKVKDENGTTIEGARVQAIDETNTSLWDVNTDTAGTASEDILFATASCAGTTTTSNYLLKTINLSVSKNGYETYKTQIYDPQEKQIMNITLKPAVQVFNDVGGSIAINLNPTNESSSRGFIHIIK